MQWASTLFPQSYCGITSYLWSCQMHCTLSPSAITTTSVSWATAPFPSWNTLRQGSSPCHGHQLPRQHDFWVCIVCCLIGMMLQVFLWPMAVILLLLPLAILSGFNPTRFTLNIYFG